MTGMPAERARSSRAAASSRAASHSVEFHHTAGVGVLAVDHDERRLGQADRCGAAPPGHAGRGFGHAAERRRSAAVAVAISAGAAKLTAPSAPTNRASRSAPARRRRSNCSSSTSRTASSPGSRCAATRRARRSAPGPRGGSPPTSPNDGLHQVAEFVGRANAKRRTERLGRPIADLLSRAARPSPHSLVNPRQLPTWPTATRPARSVTRRISADRASPVREEHHRELTCGTVNFVVGDGQVPRQRRGGHPSCGRESLGDRQHAFVRIYRDDGPCRAHAL